MNIPQLTSFTGKDALRLGQRMVAAADEQKLVVGIEIFLCGRPVFLSIPDGLNADKYDWLKRKRNSVLYFGLSTQALFTKCKGDESCLVSKYARELSDYTLTPGSIPIRLSACGLVGAVTVTGLAPEDDHRFAAEQLTLFQAEG